MKNTLLILFLSISASFQAQEVIHHYDTLFYKAGFVKAVTIHSIDKNKIHFTKTTKKGIESKTHVLFSSIQSYVDYDSTGTILLERNVLVVNFTDTTKFEFKMVVDTVMVPRSNFSMNPFAFLTFGVGLDYMHRFGKKKKFAWHIPFRIITLYGLTPTILQTGFGVKFIPYNSEKLSLTIGASASFFIFDGGTYIGVPITMGVIRNITDLLTINAYGGIGPYFTLEGSRFGSVVPEFHFGLGFKFGQYFETHNTNKVKVAK